MVTFLVMGEEKGETKKTPHLQGYIQLQERKRLTQLKQLFTSAKKVHWEIARGSAQQNIDYCTKEAGRIFWIRKGGHRSQGQRSDLIDIKHMIDNNRSELDICDAYWGQWLRYWKSFRRYEGLVLRRKTYKYRHLDIHWMSGPTRCGKTRYAVELAEGRGVDYYMIHGDQMQWWDDYHGETTLIIDDYCNGVRLIWLLALLDGYRLRLPVKGAHTYANWDRVYVTTNLKACEVHAAHGNPEHRRALWARVRQNNGGNYTQWTVEQDIGQPPIRTVTAALMPPIIPPIRLQDGIPPLGAITGPRYINPRVPMELDPEDDEDGFRMP